MGVRMMSLSRIDSRAEVVKLTYNISVLILIESSTNITYLNRVIFQILRDGNYDLTFYVWPEGRYAQ